MDASDFRSRLRESVLVGDGAVGTLLHARGVSLEESFDGQNVLNPDLVRTIHAEYVAAGADLIETNTYAVNRNKLLRHDLADRTAEIAEAGARLAREAAGDVVVVAGAIGPIGRLADAEAEPPDDAARRAIFREVIEGLARGGVDAFMLETFIDLEELLLAMSVAREVAPSTPVIAQMAFLAGEGTAVGVSPEEAVKRLTAAGADVVGANCGEGPNGARLAIQRMARVSDVLLSAFPNAGFPSLREGRVAYRSSPSYLASSAVRLVEAGANLVGGCCGTGPDDVRAIAEAVRGMRPAARVIVDIAFAPLAPPPPAEASAPGDETFLDVIARGETGLIVELDPPRGLTLTKVIEGARLMSELGVHLISMAENPLARVRMGNVAAAVLVRQLTGVEPLVHFTCRDRNLIGLQSDLLGAAALGLRNVLAITGDPASLGGHAGASNVFDVRSAGLVEILRTLNEGRTMTGHRMDRGTRFAIGVAFNPNVKQMEVQIRRLEKKVEAGAQFALTQPVFEPERIAEMYEKTAPLGIPIVLGVLPPASARNAEFLHNEVPGITIPEELRRRLRQAPEDGQAEVGEEIACELIDVATGLAPGFYVIPPFTRYETAGRLVRHVKSAARR